MSDWSMISVVMITRDAAATLASALGSIPAGAEILVADADSSDMTVTIARSFGALVVPQNQSLVTAAGGNFDVARNQAMKLAGRDWLFILDGDEQIPPALADEITTTIATNQDHAAYTIPRHNLFWGKPVRLLGEDRQIRLLRKGRGHYEGYSLHNPIRIDGPVGRLHEPLIHHNITCWQDVKRRFRRYLPVERRNETPAENRMAALRLVARMTRYYLFQQQAWRDGWRGIAVSCIYGVYHGMSRWPDAR